MQVETKNNKLLCKLQQQRLCANSNKNNKFFFQAPTTKLCANSNKNQKKLLCASSNNKLLFKLEQQIFMLKQEISVQAQTKTTNSLCKSPTTTLCASSSN
jgi:hypothetical protein